MPSRSLVPAARVSVWFTAMGAVVAPAPVVSGRREAIAIKEQMKKTARLTRCSIFNSGVGFCALLRNYSFSAHALTTLKTC